MKMTFTPVKNPKKKQPAKLYLMLWYDPTAVTEIDSAGVTSELQTCAVVGCVPTEEMINIHTEPDEVYLGYVTIEQ